MCKRTVFVSLALPDWREITERKRAVAYVAENSDSVRLEKELTFTNVIAFGAVVVFVFFDAKSSRPDMAVDPFATVNRSDVKYTYKADA